MHAPFIDKVDVSITETQYHLPSSSYFFFSLASNCHKYLTLLCKLQQKMECTLHW